MSVPEAQGPPQSKQRKGGSKDWCPRGGVRALAYTEHPEAQPLLKATQAQCLECPRKFLVLRKHLYKT